MSDMVTAVAGSLPLKSDRLLTEMALHDALYRDRRGANEWGAILLKR
jgi:hypothetical protein